MVKDTYTGFIILQKESRDVLFSEREVITHPYYFEIGKWTERPRYHGGIAVFDSLEHATAFLGHARNLNLHIYKCEYIPHEYVMFPHHNIRTINETYTMHVPFGERYVKRVKVIKKVQALREGFTYTVEIKIVLKAIVDLLLMLDT